MRKNTAGQTVGAQLNSKTDGSAVTSGTTTVYVLGDGGTQSAGSVGSGACTHEGNGFWTYAPAQAETNYDHAAYTFVNSSAVTVTVQIYPGYPQTGDSYARIGAPAGASASADIAAITTNIGTAGVGLTNLGDTRIAHLNADVSSRAQAGDAMALTSGERTTLAAAIWNALTSGMTTAGSIGKRIVDYLTGDVFARIGAPVGASISADIVALKTDVDSISVATNAGNLATKESDSATLTTGTTISGTYASTATNDLTYWITAPVTPAVSGFGLREQLVFDLPLGRIPVGIQIRGYWNGSGQTVDVYALNNRTASYDKLTNSNTNLASRNSDAIYSIPLPRDYGDDTGGSYNIITLEFRSASTNTANRLRVDQILVAHVAEDVAITSTAPTTEQIWTYITRELTTPGVDPVTVPTAAEIRAEMDANSTKLAHLNVDVSTLSTYDGSDTAGTTTLLSRITAAPLLASAYTAPDNAGIAAVKTKTDNLPSDPADASDIASAFSTVNSTLATIAGYVDTEVAAIKAKTDLIPASPAAVSDIPSAAAIADEVETRTIAAVTMVNGLAANTVTAAALASDAVTEIQTGLAADSALTSIVSDVSAIKEYADRTVIRGTVSSTTPTTTQFTCSALSPAGVDADQFNGRIIVFDNDTVTTALRGQATNVIASSADALPLLTFTALTTAPQDGDSFSVV